MKSGIMVGLGESFDELKQAMNDLHNSGCQLLTIGQYLAPSQKHHPIERFYAPPEFDELKNIALKIGFWGAVSGPLIRSSYQASKMYSDVDRRD